MRSRTSLTIHVRHIVSDLEVNYFSSWLVICAALPQLFTFPTRYHPLSLHNTNQAFMCVWVVCTEPHIPLALWLLILRKLDHDNAVVLSTLVQDLPARAMTTRPPSNAGLYYDGSKSSLPQASELDMARDTVVILLQAQRHRGTQRTFTQRRLASSYPSTSQAYRFAGHERQHKPHKKACCTTSLSNLFVDVLLFCLLSLTVLPYHHFRVMVMALLATSASTSGIPIPRLAASSKTPLAMRRRLTLSCSPRQT